MLKQKKIPQLPLLSTYQGVQFVIQEDSAREADNHCTRGTGGEEETREGKEGGGGDKGRKGGGRSSREYIL